jgi:hypothetical protein
MKEKAHNTDLCIIGGGITGVCAAIVVLMQDRPVLGGNSSSEIRMWICGAHGENNRETGILEELELENLYRNPEANFYIWDSVLYEKVMAEKNITLLLNCSCVHCEMEADKIVSVRGWQLTSETYHTVTAKLFADCSGDSVLAPLSGAEYRVGREASSEFNESIQPLVADKKTMGHSILFQARETMGPQRFIPPSFAYRYENDDAFPFKSLRGREHDGGNNYWWIEVGGEYDTIHDTESLREELLKIAFGVWDHMKNHGEHGMDNWVLEWIGFLPGKRESRRYVGDYIMNQNDVEAGGRFDDLVAYGGWSMDDHHPAGFYHDGAPTIFHPAPSPFGIPYRCLYSKNIQNLFFAGRNISVTHAAMSATRVQGTCSTLGSAVGMAAVIAVQWNLAPREVYHQKMAVLKQRLMEMDCYLPYNTRKVPELTAQAQMAGAGENLEALRDGFDRPLGGQSHSWVGKTGDGIVYHFKESIQFTGTRLVFDSHLNRSIRNMPCSYPLQGVKWRVPESLVKSFIIEVSEDGEKYIEIYRETNNYQRLVNVKLDGTGRYIRLTPLETWGCDQVRIFSFDINGGE